jgi:hypothetical protein
MSPELAGSTPTSPEAREAAVQGYRVLWGYYDVSMNADTGEIEAIPLRSADYRFNVNKFLQPPAGDPNNLAIAVHDASQFQSTGRIEVDVTITHPFPGSPALRGFDVMGVFITNGSFTGYLDPTVTYTSGGNTQAELVNADGYTRWMNAMEFTQSGLLGYTHGNKGIPGFIPNATVNGYKYYAEFLGVDEDLSTFFQTPLHVTARGSFLPGSSLTRRYMVKFPIVSGKPQLKFNYAVLASWASAGVPNPTLDDFPPQANLQEAITLSVVDNGSDLYYVDPTDLGGSLRLNIEFFDWQGASNPGGFPAELAYIRIEDSGGQVIPGGSVDVLPSASVSTGSGNSAIFTIEITNCAPQGSGRQEFLITAESASPTDYDNSLGAPYPVGAPLAAFSRYTSTVYSYNPCPTPAIGPVSQPIVTLNSTHLAYQFYGNNFASGSQLAAEFRRSSGDVVGTNVSVVSISTAQADFDFNGFSAGRYDMYFKNGCGTAAALSTAALEINTPPTSIGITGPASGDGNLIASYNSNASDVDTDPVDTLTITWELWDMTTLLKILGPVTGDPFLVAFAGLPIGPHEVRCNISDGFVPDDLNLIYPITRNNTQPTISDPAGPNKVWVTSSFTYSVVATEIDSGQTLTYAWSFEPQGNPANYALAGDPTPGDITVNFVAMPSYVGSGYYVLDCRVNDGSGAPNATATCTTPLTIYVGNPPYTDPIPIAKFNQIVCPAPSTTGIVGCPSFWDGYYQPGVPIQHPDICVLSGPSLGSSGVMVLGDELGALVIIPPPPPTMMAFAYYGCPYVSGTPPNWSWFTAPQFPLGAGMAPSVVHFDGNINAEFLLTNSQMTNMLAGFGIPDPSAFEFYNPFVGKISDLFTSLNAANVPDAAVDASAGFDMGSPSSPDNPPLYGLFTQDSAGIIFSCGGPQPSPLPALSPVNVMEFPSGAVQPVGAAVDLPGSIAIVARLPFGLCGVGPGFFNYGGGGPAPGGPLVFPEPYYALGIDDDDADNPWPTGLPMPVGRRVMIATIDGDRDLEIYEADFGVMPPGPAPIVPFANMPMGSFLGGTPTAYPLDCEFISNFSKFGGTPKQVWPDDLLAVLLTEPIGGFWIVEIFQLAPGTPVSISLSMPVPVPVGVINVPGVAYRLDVDEVTGEIYVLHLDTAGSPSQTVTIIPY